VRSILPKRAVVGFSLLLMQWVSAVAADGSAEPPFRNYSVIDGLTQSEVHDIEQDLAGYLWFSTARGLNRFDGESFDHFTITDGLPNNSLTALHVDATNRVLVGDVRGGISILDGARVTQTISPFGDTSAAIIDIEAIDDVILAIVEDVGIVVISTDGESIDTDLIGGTGAEMSNLEISGRDIWAVGDTGLYKVMPGESTPLLKVSNNITHIHADHNQRLWAANKGNQIGVWTDMRFSVRAAIDTDESIVGIATSSEGTVWAATSNALFKFDSNNKSILYSGAGLKRFDRIDQVSSLFVDREDTLWLASDSRLIRFLGDRFEHYRLQTNNDPVTVWGISEDRLGRFWFATQQGLVLRGTDETLVKYNEEFGVPEGAVRDVVTDPQGNIWFGVEQQGLYSLNVQSNIVRLIESTRGVDILDVAIGIDGAIWYSTGDAGLARYSSALDSLEKFESPGMTPVYTFDVADDGSIWYGADEVGLVHLVREATGQYEQTVFGRENGLDNRFFDHINLSGPAEAWIATEEGGLYRFKNGKFLKTKIDASLADQTLYLVEQLDNGSIVVGGEQGLYQISPDRAGITHYNQSIGFIGLETNVHATYFDSENKLWIGTVNGASRMDTSRAMPSVIDPVPTIINAETVLDHVRVSNSEEIKPDLLGVQIEFAAISLLNPNGIEYSYRLDGADENWGSATKNRIVSYPRLSPGSYEFMVRARYPGGIWGDEYASFRFTVLPFFWQQPVFVFSLIIGLLLLIRAAFVFRTRSIKRQNALLTDQVRERTRSIESARQKLEKSNLQLSEEVENRKRSELARAEFETRFQNAFENSPIGMGLMDEHCFMFDANPALKNMIWPGENALPDEAFATVFEGSDQQRFAQEFVKFVESGGTGFEGRFSCHDSRGECLQVHVNLAAVAADEGEFLYAVLQVQDITENLKLNQRLERQASFDELTELLNRRAFETELQRAWEASANQTNASCLMFLDLDQFKVVNDTSGHNAGDQLLKAVSKILLHNVRANDVVARIGGDEFGIILWDCPMDVAARIAESIRRGIEDFRFHWEKETYRIGVSIGGLPVEQSVGDINELQQLADAACYSAKEEGRNRVHMIAGDKDLARERRGQVRWVQRIRDAMDNNRFAIFGQLIKPLDETIDEPENIEILLRLRDPETRKLIPPGAFLPAAERYGLSVELDRWVVSSLLDTLFIHNSFQAENRMYWINLSGMSIGDKRFADFLKSAMKRSPLPPGTINFEITETAVIRSIEEAGKLISDLRDMGCKFALDDFGSGLSSFGYLKHLPVDNLKIDGMFIRDILQEETSRIFVKSIIDIARSLGIKTTAEFVENQEMLDVVRELGADYAQGFHFGRPFVLAPKLPEIRRSVDEPIDLIVKAG